VCRVIRVGPAEPAVGNVSAPARERDDGGRLTYDAALARGWALGESAWEVNAAPRVGSTMGGAPGGGVYDFRCYRFRSQRESSSGKV